MKLIIAGGRDSTRAQFDLALYHANACDWPIVEVVSGACPTGADYWGEQWAKAWGIPVKRFPADWAAHGKSAGPKRNREMAEYADALIAIWDGKSRGTANMIQCAQARRLRIYIHRTDAPMEQA